jgi:hypothetical protein
LFFVFGGEAKIFRPTISRGKVKGLRWWWEKGRRKREEGRRKRDEGRGEDVMEIAPSPRTIIKEHFLFACSVKRKKLSVC